MGKRGPQPGAVAKAAKQAKVAQPTTLKAQGATTKRTPTGAFDPATGKETYEVQVEDVVGEKLERGVTKFQVKWKGWASTLIIRGSPSRSIHHPDF